MYIFLIECKKKHNPKIYYKAHFLESGREGVTPPSFEN